MRSLRMLNKKKFKINNPDGGDGLLSFILETIYESLEIKPINWIVEFGAHPGKGGVFLGFLIEKGYKAILIEGGTNSYEGLLEEYKGNKNVTCINSFIDYKGSNTLDIILSKTDLPKVIDVLLIDVDSIDYQIWESLNNYEPLVLIIEFQENYGPYLNRIHNINLNHWSAEKNINTKKGHYIGTSSIAGSSITAINELAKKKGYALITTTRNNAFFVKEELFHFFHLQEIDIERNFTSSLLNIPNRVLSISDIMKKIYEFGFTKTFIKDLREKYSKSIFKKLFKSV